MTTTTCESRTTRQGRTAAALWLALLLVATMAGIGARAAAAGTDNNVLRTIGDESLTPNVQVRANLKFAPGQLRIASGDALRIEHADKTTAPHTVTIVDPSEQPQTFEDLFDPSFCSTCEAAGFEHFVNGSLVVDGGDGFNAIGDSILFFPGESVEIDVTAAPGTTLAYMCIIHPWMQGTFTVT